MEIEINFRLDENCRTTSLIQQHQQRVEGAKDGRGDHDNHMGGTSAGGSLLDYSYRVAMTNLRDPFTSCEEEHVEMKKDRETQPERNHQQQQQHQQWLDDLLLDCEISDSGLMPRTFWVPCQGFQPRCTLEQFALDVFHHHVPYYVGLHYDIASSGVEWWCQIRPSPEKTGRYSMHCRNDEEEEEDEHDDPFTHGVSFHVDKDEELRILTGGMTNVHPHLSTVTYLTDLGSPTMIMNCRVHPLEGTWIVPEHQMEGFLSWPATGKHISFDGRYLHAAPCNLMEDGAFHKQIEFVSRRMDDCKWHKLQTRRHRRVTFLVNIWLNHKPFDVNPFPATMIDKMSGQIKSERRNLRFHQTVSFASTFNATNVRNAIVTPSSGNTEGGSQDYNETSKRFVWPLGDKRSKERLELLVPMHALQAETPHCGNVQITWKNDSGEGPGKTSFRLYFDESSCDCSGEDTQRADLDKKMEGRNAKRVKTERRDNL